MNSTHQRYPSHQTRHAVASLCRYTDTARLFIAVSICGVCQTSFAVTDTELAENVCVDAVQSAQLEDEAEIKAMMRQCVEQLTLQLEDDSVTEG